MRAAVIGATGNVGTAVLRRIRSEHEITEVVGIARRRPTAPVEPYDDVRWVPFDVGQAATARQEPGVHAALTAALAGVDALVHLAWAIQPNHERDALRRTNVDGTRRVLEAAAAAGVSRVVVASSVGAYAPVADDELRDESHALGGVRSSHYSVDKVAQDRLVQAFADAHPEITVSWLRPALIFQGAAGAEIHRYFLGAFVPQGAVAPGRLPVLPWPQGMRLQAVHADDVADAYVRALMQGARGAFNIAAQDVLREEDVADVLGAGRVVAVPRTPVRASLSAAWHSRAVTTDAGWFDMGAGVPLLDTTRARTELGWSPRRTAKEALRELVEALAAGTGHPSPPLRDLGEPGLPDATIDAGRLGRHLASHLTAASAGAMRFRDAARRFADHPVAPELEDLADEIAGERDDLLVLIDVLGLDPHPARAALAGVGGRLARMWPGTTAPMDPGTVLVLELEVLRGMVMAKQGLWEVLAELSEPLGLSRERFDQLAATATEQRDRLAALHADARGDVFRPAGTQD